MKTATTLAAALAATLIASPALAGDAAAGAKLFKAQCGICHATTASAPAGVGPKLHGVVGRKAGITPHFRYSAAMRQSGIVWTPDKLRPYIHEPQKTIPNIRMSFLGLKNMRDVDDVIAYLETFK